MRSTLSVLARAWLALLLCLAVLPPLAAVPAAHATSHQEPTIDRPEQVPIYRPEPGRIAGRVSIPDEKLAVLVQPEGRAWREFRTVWLRVIAAVLILGISAGLAAFYLWRGRIRIEAGRSGQSVLRFNGAERAGHWITAISFLVLAVSGLVVTFGRPLLIPLVGHQAFTPLAETAKQVHNFFGVPFVAGLLMILVLWVRDNIPEKADLTWLRQAGGLLQGCVGVHPEAGRFNAGQKMIFWLVVLGGTGLAITGWLLLVPFYAAGIGGMQIAHVIHGLLAAVLIAVIIGHIYIGSIGMEGAFDAVGSGRVDENWAREHHSRWYAQLRGQEEAAPPPDAAGGHRLPAE